MIAAIPSMRTKSRPAAAALSRAKAGRSRGAGSWARARSSRGHSSSPPARGSSSGGGRAVRGTRLAATSRADPGEPCRGRSPVVGRPGFFCCRRLRTRSLTSSFQDRSRLRWPGRSRIGSARPRPGGVSEAGSGASAPSRMGATIAPQDGQRSWPEARAWPQAGQVLAISLRFSRLRRLGRAGDERRGTPGPGAAPRRARPGRPRGRRAHRADAPRRWPVPRESPPQGAQARAPRGRVPRRGASSALPSSRPPSWPGRRVRAPTGSRAPFVAKRAPTGEPRWDLPRVPSMIPRLPPRGVIIGERLAAIQACFAARHPPADVVLRAMPRIIECVPNISEGRRPEVVAEAVAALKAVPGLRVLDVQSDRDHNRSVLTLAGDEAALRAGIPELFAAAVARIDLRTHTGEHPRVGAVDVVPFIPIEGTAMADCVALAQEVGGAVAGRFRVPVFLYEEAAAAPHRRNLEDIRRGEFEGLNDKMRDPQWAPDFGPSAPHASAGASVVGARMPLIAYNVNLGTSDLEVAKRIAKAIRFSSGGYRFVKAMGVMLQQRNQAQVSINMTDFKKTPLSRVFETVKAEAARYGVSVVGSEIVGLVPAEALIDAADHFLRLERFDPSQVLERRIRETE